MNYLYKLVDEEEAKLANEGIISFSHPIFEFKGSEGMFINFAKRIYDKYSRQGKDIVPSPTDLEDIKEWVDAYKLSGGGECSDKDIISDSMIIFCGIMQGFCGYFTAINIFEKDKLSCFLQKSKLKDKTSVLQIDYSIFECYQHWRTLDLKEPFCPFEGDSDDLQNFNGFIHTLPISYKENFNDYNELLKIFNANSVRRASNWFNHLSKKYEWQQEIRLIFLLRSLEKNSSRIGCKRVYNKMSNGVEDQIYCNIVDAIDYCQTGPRFIYLDVGKDKLQLRRIDEII